MKKGTKFVSQNEKLHVLNIQLRPTANHRYKMTFPGENFEVEIRFIHSANACIFDL